MQLDDVVRAVQIGMASVNARFIAVAERLAALESRAPEKGDKGDSGRDADPIAMSEVVHQVMAGPEMKTLVSMQVAESVAEYFVAHPPVRGEKGEKGDAGKDAAPIDYEKLVSVAQSKIAQSVSEFISAHPPACGEKGDKGETGIGLTGMLINRDGSLIATMSDGRVHDLGQVQGKDALAVDDLEAAFDVERGLVLTLGAGGRKKELAVKVPVLRHIGFWQSGMTAESGNTTTHNGSLWIATRATRQEPGYQSTDWTLAARKGADGQHAPVKINGKS